MIHRQFQKSITFTDEEIESFSRLGDNKLGLEMILIGLLVSQGYDCKGIDFYQLNYKDNCGLNTLSGVDVLFTR